MIATRWPAAGHVADGLAALQPVGGRAAQVQRQGSGARRWKENAMKPSHRSLGLAGFVSVFAVLGASWLAGCSLDATESRGREASAQQGDARAADLVGMWRFVYTDERRHAVEERLASEIRDPDQ